MKYKTKKSHLFLILLLFFQSGALRAQDDEKTLGDLAGNVTDKAKKIWSGAGNMLKGMGQSFGVVGKDYYYNYRVFNDSYAPLFVAEQRLTGFLGATFKGNIVLGSLLGPTANQEFSKRKLYITLYLCAGQMSEEEYYKTPKEFTTKWGGIIGKAALFSPGGALISKATGFTGISDVTSWLGESFGEVLGSVIGSIANTFKKAISFAYKNELDKHSVLKKTIYPWQPNDNNVYYYRAFTDIVDKKPVVNGEFLSLMGTTSEFSGQFYNSSNQDIILTFSKDGVSYIVTLESNSFSTLESSTEKNSIRPAKGDTRWFEFFKTKPLSSQNAIGAIPIASEGIAYMKNISKKEDKPEYIVSDPVLYSYKLYDSSFQRSGLDVAAQGVSIGNYDQPTSGRVRDINLAQCHLWYTSAAQAKEIEEKKQEGDQQTQYSNEPFDLPEQVWITYKTEDYTYQQKITPGAVLDFTLLRPQIKEKLGFLYIVSLQTDDDKKGQQFLDRLNGGTIGQGVLYSEATIDKKNILNMTPNLNGIIDDTQGTGSSGIKGTVLLADQFTPQGLGSGPYYYILQPNDLSVEQFASVIWFDTTFYTKDKKKIRDEVMKELATTLPQWIDQYRTDKEGVKKVLATYLREKLSKSLFENPTASPESREFTKQGQQILQSLISGPISLENYPVLRKSGKNYYVIGFGKPPDDWPVKAGN